MKFMKMIKIKLNKRNSKDKKEESINVNKDIHKYNNFRKNNIKINIDIYCFLELFFINI